MRSSARIFFLSVLVVSSIPAFFQTIVKYQEPPKAIVNLVYARPTPLVDVSPQGKDGRHWLLIEQLAGLPPISDLAQPELRLAGLRFNPKTNGPSRGRYFTELRLQGIPEGAERKISGLPANPKIRFAAWAPDAQHVYFANASDDS